MHEFPLSSAFLQQYALQMRKRTRASQVGAHLRRRQGQSLEFRDLIPYTPGDDFRYIDWRTSSRFGRQNEWLVRTFHAEERMTLAISIDTRLSMRLPSDYPKVVMANWLARALGTIAIRGGDRVVLHRLFGAERPNLAAAMHEHALPAAVQFLDTVTQQEPDSDPLPNLAALHPRLPPASVWLLITDLYFETAGMPLARALTRAQNGLRWVILVDLDSWPYEKATLGEGARRIEGPGLTGQDLRGQVTPDYLATVEEAIHHHKAAFLKRCQHGGLDYVHWEWPLPGSRDMATFFKQCFTRDRVFRRLFRNES